MPFSLGLPSSSLGIVFTITDGTGLGGVPSSPAATGWLLGTVFIGGEHGYFEAILTTGAAASPHWAVANDDLGNGMLVSGITTSPDGDVYATLADPALVEDYEPWDLVYLPNGTGLIVAVARTSDQLDLRKYDLNGNLLETWEAVDVDGGWTADTPVKVDVSCNSRFIYYSDRGTSLFVFDLNSGTNRPALTPGGTVGAFKVIRPGSQVEIAGDNALALDSDRLHRWTDEGSYDVVKRLLANPATAIVTHAVELTPGGLNDQVWSLACWYDPCDNPVRVWGQVVG